MPVEVSSIEQNVNDVFALFQQVGDHVYYGEDVTQTSHMLQAAKNAENDGQPVEVVLGSLLHDIGNLLTHQHEGEKIFVESIDLGFKDHDKVGEDFLAAKGFPKEVYCFATGHVSALRYLARTEPKYTKCLSKPCQLFLEYEGGPMSAEEVAEFEKLPNYETIVKFRKWDEAAKAKHAKTDPLEKYRQMAIDYLTNRQTQ